MCKEYMRLGGGSDAPAIQHLRRPLTVQSGSDTYIASHIDGHHFLIKYWGWTCLNRTQKDDLPLGIKTVA